MTTDHDLIVIDTHSMAWETGREVIDRMAPAFRNNLGPTDDHYDAFLQKTLWIDPESGRRADLFKMRPGYGDASVAYHDCVEECFALRGRCELWGEGILDPGEYFWRPPGWVHGAGSESGFVGLLFLESKSVADGSGPVSRVIRPDEEAGTNPLHGDGSEAAVGPRGFIKRADSALLPWVDGVTYARGEGALDGFDLDNLRVKYLSRNLASGGQTVLMEFAPGYRQAGPGRHAAALQSFVLEGSLQADGQEWGQGTYIRRPADGPSLQVASAGGAVVLAKSDGWLAFIPA